METVVDTDLNSQRQTVRSVAVSVHSPTRRRAGVLALYSMILALTTAIYAAPRVSVGGDTGPTPPFRVIPSTSLFQDTSLRAVETGSVQVSKSPSFVPLLLKYGEQLGSKTKSRRVLTNKAPVPSPAVEVVANSGEEARRIRVRDRSGKTVVARVHGGSGADTHVMLPDGELGIPDELTYTDDTFQVASPREISASLIAGPLAGFSLKSTKHYLVFYKSREDFADESARLLEELYSRLFEIFQRKDILVQEPEFPLVAVIFGTEKEFREFREVDPLIRAYYEIYTNRIYFFETSANDEAAPELAALRRPQTVNHEGTHQILQNIGVQPRLSPWPPWLVEGLAEYCSTPSANRKGTTWSILGAVNSQHLATIRDLADPLAGQFLREEGPINIGRRSDRKFIEYLVRKTDLTATDYALSWALTQFLALKRGDDFVEYVRTMSRLSPLQTVGPEEQLATFRQAFGRDLSRLNREINRYLGKLKITNQLPFYTLVFEQRMPGDRVRRGAIVSQSASMILQWRDTVTDPRGEPPAWHVFEFATRTPALAMADTFVRGE